MTSAPVPPRPSPRQSDFRAGRLPAKFWVLWSGVLINRLGTLVEPFLGVYLVTARGFPVAAVGELLAIYALGSMISQILGGVLADALGRRATLTGGMLANGACLLGLSYSTSTPTLIAMTFAAGATTDIYRPAAQALVADQIPAPGRARAYGLLSWAANLGFSAAMLCGGMLAQSGFGWLFRADALTCAVFAALAWRASPPTHTRPPARRKQANGFGRVLRDRAMTGYALVTLASMAVCQQAYTTLPIAMHASGLSPRAYGLVMALNGILIVILQPLASRWLATRDPNLLAVAGTLLTGAGFAATALASTTAGYAGAASGWTLGEIAMTMASAAIVTSLAPAHQRGRYLGLYGAASSLGAFLAPLGGSQLLRLGPSILWLTCGALAVTTALGQTVLAPAIRNRTSSSAGQTLDTPSMEMSGRPSPQPSGPGRDAGICGRQPSAQWPADGSFSAPAARPSGPRTRPKG